VDAVLQWPALRHDLTRCLSAVDEPAAAEGPAAAAEDGAERGTLRADTGEPRQDDEALADQEWLVQASEVNAEGDALTGEIPDLLWSGSEAEVPAADDEAGVTEADDWDVASSPEVVAEATRTGEPNPSEGLDAAPGADVTTCEDEDTRTEARQTSPVDDDSVAAQGSPADAGFDAGEPEFDLIEAPPPGEAGGPRQMRVLVAEDNRTNRLVIEKMLGGLNISLTFAENGEIAVEQFQWQRPDLIFTDISMPKMDGKEAARRIRGIEKEGNADPCPIIAITAHALEGDADEILAAGIDFYLTKPVKKAELVSHILEHCPVDLEPVLPVPDQAAAASVR
jgi:CheY-like chemotaxis protein